MTERERLIELLYQKQWQGNSIETGINYIENSTLADHLLANGVIVPPCKAGDKVYITASVSKEIVESVVLGVWMMEDNISILTIHGSIHNNSLGKTVFLTKEDAEAKLKELGK